MILVACHVEALIDLPFQPVLFHARLRSNAKACLCINVLLTGAIGDESQSGCLSHLTDGNEFTSIICTRPDSSGHTDKRGTLADADFN